MSYAMDHDEEAQFSEIWAEAFKEYEKKTKRPLLRDPSLRTLRTTKDLFDHLDKQEGRFSGFLKVNHKLWGRLEKTMVPVQLVGDAVQASIGGTEFSPVAAIFVATAFLIKAARGVSEAYASITDLLERLTDFTDRLAEYAKGAIDAKLRKRITEILATLLEVLACSERLIDRGRVKEFARIAFLGKDDDVAKGISRLQKLVDSEGRYVAAKTYSTAQSIDKELIESKKERVEDRDKKILADALSSGAVMKVAAIQAHNFSDRQQGSGEWLKREKLYKAWLMEEGQILWILGGPGAGKSFLTSSIVSHLLQLHPQDPERPSQVSSAYFYIKEDDAELRSLNTILKCLAYQLQSNNSVYSKYLVTACSASENTVTAAATWTNLFLNFFGSTNHSNHAAFLVLDGIDEAPRKERDMLFRLLYEMETPLQWKHAQPRIQVLLIGRPDLRDDAMFIWDQPIIYIEVSAAKTKADIKAYIESRVIRVRALKQAREPIAARLQLRKDIIKKLNAGADGMFLWVNLMLDQIYNMSRPSDIHEALSNAPKSLTKMIRRVFERLAEDLRGFRKDDLNEILAWVTCAERPLTLSELDAILKLRPPIGEGVPDLEERLRSQFASFFVLTRKDGLTTEALLERSSQKIQPDTYDMASLSSTAVEDGSEGDLSLEPTLDGYDDDYNSDGSDSFSFDASLLPEVQASDIYGSEFSTTTVRFSHASIRDYLLRESDSKKREFQDDLGIGIDHARAEKHITLMCLRTLSKYGPLPKLDKEKIGREVDKTNLENYENEETERDDISSDIAHIVDNLTSYSAVHFLKHMARLQSGLLSDYDEYLICTSLLRLFSDEDLIEAWIDMQTKNGETISGLAIVWLGDPTNAMIVRSWLKNQLTKPHLYTSHTIERMERFANSSKELFRAAATVCAKRWLVSNFSGYHMRQYVWVTNVWQASGDEYGDSPELHAILSRGVTISGLSQTRIVELAEMSNLPKTSYWHAHVADAMLLAGHTSAAIEGFLVAINLDKTNDVAMIGLAKCYSLHEAYEPAIMWMRKALAWSHNFKPWFESYLWQTVALWNLELGNVVEAKRAAEEACRIAPEDGTPLSAYILVLEADNDQEGLLAFAESLEKRISNDESDSMVGESLLSGALLGNDTLLETLGRSAKAAGKLEFVIRAAEAAIEVAGRKLGRQEEANQRLLLASLLFAFAGDENKAVKLWELVLHSTENITHTGDFTSIRQEASEHLSQVYYSRAKSAEQLGVDHSLWISKLQNLAKIERAECSRSAARNFTSMRMLSIGRKFASSRMLGYWHHLHGNEDEAKNCVRRSILESLDDLADQSVNNGGDGWFALAECLIKVGDRVNAEAAYAVTFQDVIGCDVGEDIEDMIIIDQREVLREQDDADQLVVVEQHPLTDEMVVIDTIESACKANSIRGIESNLQNALPCASQDPPPSVVDPILLPISAVSLSTDGPRPEGITFTSSKSSPFFWECDGQCKRRPAEWMEIHICEACHGSTCFCEECIVKLKSGGLGFRVCDPAHSFFRWVTHKAGKIGDESGSELGRDFVVVAGKEVPLAAWLTELREIWKDPMDEREA